MRVVIAKKPFKGNPVGSEVEVRARDARVLFALGRAEPAADVVAIAAVEVEPEPEVEAKPQKRVYRRRDMTAED